MADLIDRQTAIEALGERPLCWSEGEWESGLIAQWEAERNVSNLWNARAEMKADDIFHFCPFCGAETENSDDT